MSHPARRTAGRSARRVAGATAVLAAALLVAPTADGDVLRFPLSEGDATGSKGTLIRPDGSRQALAWFPESRGRGPVAPAVDPLHRYVARIVGTRIAVLPLDGSPTRTLREPSAPAVDGAAVWWSADGASLAAGPVRTPDGAPAVRRCAVPAMVCTVQRTGRRIVVGAAPDGRLLLTGDAGRGPLRALDDATDDVWHDRTVAWVRRTTRVLDRQVRDDLVLEAAVGRPARTLWRSLRSPTQGRTIIYTLAPSGTASGALLQWGRRGVRLDTRRRHGRLQARLRTGRWERAGYWQVSTDGRLRSLHRLATTPAVPLFPTPDGGWITILRGLTKYGDSRLGTVAPDGSRRGLTVAGRRITNRRLHDALGLPAATRPPKANPDFGPDQRPFVPLGVEATTRSVILYFDDGRSSLLVRVSLDGGTPTIADRDPELPGEVVAW